MGAVFNPCRHAAHLNFSFFRFQFASSVAEKLDVDMTRRRRSG